MPILCTHARSLHILLISILKETGRMHASMGHCLVLDLGPMTKDTVSALGILFFYMSLVFFVNSMCTLQSVGLFNSFFAMSVESEELHN